MPPGFSYEFELMDIRLETISLRHVSLCFQHIFLDVSVKMVSS
jgi:hypothetical protein